MSFYERSSWVSLVIVVVTAVAYGALLWVGLGDTPQGTAVLLIAATALIVIAEVCFHILIALPLLRYPEEAKMDERDKLVDWRAESAGALVLGAVVIVAIGQIVVSDAFFSPTYSVYAAHLLFLGLVLAEAVTGTYRILLYRKGF